MATLSPSPKIQVIGADGVPIIGALLYTYEASTDTPKTTYTDSTCSTASTNPVVSDSNGYIEVWLGAGAYKYILTDGVGATLFDPAYIEGTTIYTIDNITASGSSTSAVTVVSNLAALKALPTGVTGDAVIMLGYADAGDGGGGEFYWDNNSSANNDNGVVVTPASSTGAGRWIRNLVGTEVNARWYGALGTGSDNDTPAFIAANTFCETGDYTLIADAGIYLWSSDPSLTVPIRLMPNAIIKPSAHNPEITTIINDDTKHFIADSQIIFPAGYELNVKWFGATGDGTTDDSMALYIAGVCVPAGGTLYIPATDDSYLVVGGYESVIVLKSNMNIRGDGDKSLIKCDDDFTASDSVIGHAVSSAIADVRIEGIAIDGNTANDYGTGILINSVGGYIRNCNIYDMAQCGINSYSTHFTIENNEIVDSGTFIAISNADTVNIYNNNLTATDETAAAVYGVYVAPTASKDIVDTIISGNICIGVPIYAIAAPASQKITSLTINENTVDLSRTNLAGYTGGSCITCLEAVGTVQIARNILFPSDSTLCSGIYCGSVGTARALQQSISGNVIRIGSVDIAATTHAGINVSWSSGSVIKDNNIRAIATSTDYGIVETGTCTNIFKKSNVIINLADTTEAADIIVTEGTFQLIFGTSEFTVQQIAECYWKKETPTSLDSAAIVTVCIKGFVGTSNSGSMNSSTLWPVEINPRSQTYPTYYAISTIVEGTSGGFVIGSIGMQPVDRTCGIYKGVVSGTAIRCVGGTFTSSGTKGLFDTTIVYPIWP